MNVKADSYLAIFNLTQTGSTAKEVNDLVVKKINGLKTELKTKGFTDTDFFKRL